MAYARAAAMIATPIGRIRIEADGGMLTGIRIGGSAAVEADDPLLAEAKAQLAAYFDGALTDFDLPLAPLPSDRGPALREAIRGIGYGETATYGDLAARTGASARAVGQACASNAFPIIIPCHRVLGAGGALSYYSAGDGPETKIWLLKHERAEGWLL
jgi:methylated-DNA-[protein]-cysteine S-methyltransferase